METKEVIIGEFGYKKCEIEQQIRYLKETVRYNKEQLKIWEEALKECNI